MKGLPIVERELRVAARDPKTYNSRLALPAVGGVILLCLSGLAGGAVPQHSVGSQLFYVCFGMLFISCLFGGCQLTADTISSERREGTLGFLFLTDLKGIDIILGKLVATSVGTVYGALGLLPLAAIIFLLGGVNGGVMLRLAVSSLNVLFASLAVGMLCSCLSLKANQARSRALFALIGVSVAGPLAGFIYSWAHDFPAGHRGLTYWGGFLATSPAVTFASSLDVLYQNNARLFWLGNLATHLAGWVFLGSACWLVPRVWQQKAHAKRVFLWSEWWRKFNFGTSQKMAARRAQLLDMNAVHWLTYRERFKDVLPWVVIGMVFVLWLVFWCFVGNDWFQYGIVFFVCILINSIFKIWITSESARRFSADRESGALELLLCTSMPVAEILRGQLLSITRQFRKPLLILTGMEVLLFLISIKVSPDKVYPAVALAFIAGIVVLWADVLTIPWVAMWTAMFSKKPQSSNAEAAIVVMLAPWGLWHFANTALTFIMGWFFGWRFFSEVMAVILWLVVCLLYDYSWMRKARAGLFAEFRIRAMAGYLSEEPKTWWYKWGRYVAQRALASKVAKR